jgi:hypothetical protein
MVFTEDAGTTPPGPEGNDPGPGPEAPPPKGPPEKPRRPRLQVVK